MPSVLALLAQSARMFLLVGVMVPFGLSFWPVAQASSIYDTTVPQEQSCVARGHNRYRC